MTQVEGIRMTARSIVTLSLPKCDNVWL